MSHVRSTHATISEQPTCTTERGQRGAMLDESRARLFGHDHRIVAKCLFTVLLSAGSSSFCAFLPKVAAEVLLSSTANFG